MSRRKYSGAGSIIEQRLAYYTWPEPGDGCWHWVARVRGGERVRDVARSLSVNPVYLRTVLRGKKGAGTRLANPLGHRECARTGRPRRKRCSRGHACGYYETPQGQRICSDCDRLRHKRYVKRKQAVGS